MTPNPLQRESEARRDGPWWRVYAPALVCVGLMGVVAGYLAYLAYRSTHSKGSEIIIIPSNWTLTNHDRSIEVGGTVPGGVYTDLLNANVLSDGDFYYRYNDLGYRWVSSENWTYSTTLTVTPDVVDHERVVLIFEGLDTVSEVLVNGETVGSSDNMFVRYLFDVKQQLQNTTEVSLEVKFKSPVQYANDYYQDQASDYVVPPKCVDPAFKGICHANHIRKMQASFSWDWGPAFPNSGIWKEWHLVGWNTLLVSDVSFSATPTSVLPSVPNPNLRPGWTVFVKVWMDAALESGIMEGDVIISLGDIRTSNYHVNVSVEEFKALLNFNFTLEEDQVNMWWPNGYGSQALYSLTVEWGALNRNESSRKTVRVGFRTVELNQDFVDSNNETKGRHYRVLVNNVHMFMKGSNWIPAHVLPEMVTEKYTRRLLQDAADTHQNCIRVWGGGIYESDVFYEIADELGILIWQDLMFACSMYPVKPDFLDTVRSEVETQVRRLQHHASILLWAGNNENEAALRGNWYGTASNFEKYKEDYIILYVDTIRNLTEELDMSRPFVVSSPNNGIESEEEGHVALHPYNNLYGDVHYYNYLSDAWHGHATPRTRFASEYGFQSWPSFKSMKKVTSEEDWTRGSAMMYHRQHHPAGQEELALQIGLHMHMPPSDGSTQSFKDYLYLSQVHQAMAIKTETEFYRRGMSELNEAGEGFTSGALYWQLNDIWQGASWASIEYGGRWKMLHYYSKKFFAPILVSLYQDYDEELKVHIVSDLTELVTGLTLIVDLHRYDHREKVKSFTFPVDVSPGEANLAATLNLWNDLDMETHCHQGLYDEVDVCFVVSYLLTSNDTLVAPDNFYLFGKPKDAHLPIASIKIDGISGPVATGNSNWTFSINISSDAVALFVWLESDEDGVFSDNGFLMKENLMELFFYAAEETTLEALHNSLSVTSLTNTYTMESAALAQAAEAVVDRAFHPNDIRNVFNSVYV